jgi:hypothetical protein
MCLVNLKSLTTNPYRSIQVHQALRQLANITVGILLAKSMLALGEIGMFEQLLFIGYVLTYFLSNGLAQAFLTEYPRLEKGEAKSFLDQVYQIHLAIAMVMLLVLFVGELAVKTILVSNPGLSYYTYFAIYLVIYFVGFRRAFCPVCGGHGHTAFCPGTLRSQFQTSDWHFRTFSPVFSGDFPTCVEVAGPPAQGVCSKIGTADPVCCAGWFCDSI